MRLRGTERKAPSSTLGGARRALTGAALLTFLLFLGLFSAPDLNAQIDPNYETTITDIGVPLSADREDAHFPYEHGFVNYDRGLFRPRSTSMDPEFKIGPGRLQLPAPYATLGALGAALRADIDSLLLQRGFKPEEAMLRLGPFYGDISSVTTAVLASDNVNQTQHDREAGMIGIISLNDIAIVGQFFEGFRLAVAGDFVMLPFEGKMGLNGFGLDRDVLDLALQPGVALDEEAAFGLEGLQGALSYDFRFAGWDVFVQDSVGVEDFEVAQDFDVFLDSELEALEQGWELGATGEQFDEEDQAGNYSFGGAGRGGTGSEEPGLRETDKARMRRRTTDEWEDTYTDEANLDFSNYFSVTLTREAPAQLRPEITIYRRDSDYWYAENKDEEPRPEWHEGLSIALITERENMRFPPYVQYTISRDSDDRDWTKVLRLGIAGLSPITQHMSFTGNVGYAWDNEGEAEWVYGMTVFHQPRELTLHSLTAARHFTEPEDELQSEITYRLRQILGPYLSAQFIASWTETERRGDQGREGDEEEWGVGGSLLFYPPGDKLTIAFRSYYEDTWEDIEEGAETQEDAEWRHVLDVTYRFTDDIIWNYEHTWADDGDEWSTYFDARLYSNRNRNLQLIYRFRWEDASDEEGYFENLLVLSYTRQLSGYSLRENTDSASSRENGGGTGVKLPVP